MWEVWKGQENKDRGTMSIILPVRAGEVLKKKLLEQKHEQISYSTDLFHICVLLCFYAHTIQY